MSEIDIVIRDFTLNDVAFLADLTNTLGYNTTVEQMKNRMETIINLDNYWTFVSVSKGKVIGYIGLNKNHMWEQDGCYLRIQALVVDKEYRRFGVGEQLIHAAEKLARQVNVKIILLNCGNRKERESAHKFYPKMGFQPKSTGYIKRLS